MKKRSMTLSFLLAIIVTSLSSTTHAQNPLWTFIPLTPTNIVVPANITKVIQYIVTNQTKHDKTLMLVPVTGITQTSNGAGACANPFFLKANDSCTLTLMIDGSQLQGNPSSGPIICPQSPDGSPSLYHCNQPSQADILNLTTTGNILPITVAGGYSDSSTTRPMLALSQDEGGSWTFPDMITTPNPNPPFVSNGNLYGAASCSENTCIASGDYIDSDSTLLPLLALSKTGGTTWSYPTAITQPSLTPSFGSDGALLGTTCNGNICIAVGTYRDMSSIERPLLALSQDGGTNWNFPASITSPVLTPAFNSAGYLYTASCNGITCIAVGSYKDSGSTQHPLLALSQNDGTSWSFPTSITNPTLTPAFNSGGYLNDVSCSGNLCVAVGGYSSDGSNNIPLLAISTDGGVNWSFQNPTPTPAIGNNGSLNGASCSGSTCIVTGYYFDTVGVDRPLLGLSNDGGGASWTYPTSISQPVVTPAFVNYGNLIDASCNGIICIAAGSYYDGSQERLLLALSQNAGSTWTFPTTITEATGVQNFVSGSFAGVNCIGNTCFAAGHYIDDSMISRPILAQTQTGGDTWQFPTSITNPVLVPPFNSLGYFYFPPPM